MSSVVGATRFQVTKTELYVPVVTLETADNTRLNQLFETSFKRSVFWNEYKIKIETITQAENDNNFKRILLDNSFQGVNRLFVMGFNDVDGDANQGRRDDQRKFFLPRTEIKNYNVLIGRRNFYDQPIDDELRKYNEVRNIMTGKGEDYETGSLLDYYYYKKDYKLIAYDLSKQKILDSDPKSIQQIEFIFKLDNTA